MLRRMPETGLLSSFRMPKSSRCSASALSFRLRASRVVKRSTFAASIFISMSCAASSARVLFRSFTTISMSLMIFSISTFSVSKILRVFSSLRRIIPSSRCSGLTWLLCSRVASILLSETISVIFCENSLFINSFSSINPCVNIRLFFGAKIILTCATERIFLHKISYKKCAKVLIILNLALFYDFFSSFLLCGVFFCCFFCCLCVDGCFLCFFFLWVVFFLLSLHRKIPSGGLFFIWKELVLLGKVLLIRMGALQLARYVLDW